MSFPEETQKDGWDGDLTPTGAGAEREPRGHQEHQEQILCRHWLCSPLCQHRAQSHLTQELPAPPHCGIFLGMAPELFAAQHPMKGSDENLPKSPFPHPLLRAGTGSSASPARASQSGFNSIFGFSWPGRGHCRRQASPEALQKAGGEEEAACCERQPRLLALPRPPLSSASQGV